MRSIQVTSARICDIAAEGMAAHCTFELTVLPQFCNRMNNMHGGCVALLADMSTTMCTAPVSKEDFWRFGGLRPIVLNVRVGLTEYRCQSDSERHVSTASEIGTDSDD